mgnify:CR=1 FL=1
MLNYLQALELNCLFEGSLHVPVHHVAVCFLWTTLRKYLLKPIQIIFSGILNQSFARSHKLKELFFVVLLKVFNLLPNLATMKLNLPNLHQVGCRSVVPILMPTVFAVISDYCSRLCSWSGLRLSLNSDLALIVEIRLHARQCFSSYSLLRSI